MEGNLRLGLVVYTFMVTEGDLHRQDVPSTLLGVPHNPKNDVLVVKCLPHPCGLSEFIKLGSIALLLCRFSIAFLYRDICPVAAIAAVEVYACVRSFVWEFVVVIIRRVILVLVAVVKDVVVEQRVVASVTIVIVVEVRRLGQWY